MQIQQTTNHKTKTKTTMKNENQEIAATILKQLGGRRFVGMTGSKNFVAGTNGSLSFKLSGMVRKIATHCRITLNSMDTYDMEFIKVKRDYSMPVVAKHEGIYNDMLETCFTKTTGLNTHL